MEEELTVENIMFEDSTYTVYVEEYEFLLHTFTDSEKSLRDDAGEVLTPLHYIPEETVSQRYEEARNELNR